MEIDMKNYAGVNEDSAAVNQAVLTPPNSQEDYPVNQELLQQATDAASALDMPLEAVQKQPEQRDDKEINFRALREEISALKNQKDELEANFKLLRSNQIDRPQQRQAIAPQEQKKLFDNLNDDDVPTVADIRKAWDVRESEYLSRINELQVAQSHPDYEEVIEKFTVPLLNEKPYLAVALQDPRTRVSVAYDLGKLAQVQQQREVPVQGTPAPVVAQKIVDNARKPGTLSGAGGQSILSKADYYASMSDGEFIEMAKRNLDGI